MKPLLVICGGSIALSYALFFALYSSVHPLQKNMQSADMFASVFFTQSVAAPDIQKKFSSASTTGQRIKILIVPGHEPDFGGAEYKNLKERDMTVDLGHYLSEYLMNNPHYEVFATRNKDVWNQELQDYFDQHWRGINTFVASQKAEMAHLVSDGKIVRVTDGVPHNDAPSDVATRLYGINKWANEKKMDITIHIHFNDDASRRITRAGEYNGFTIYVPDRQYSNADASKSIATEIVGRIAQFSAISNFPREDSGVTEDQDLIAVGGQNTSDGASMLIEYGYIYEPQFADPETRDTALKELALQTYLGLEDFFGEASPVAEPYGTTLLPYAWDTILRKGSAPHKEILALQAALSYQGFYPPHNSNKNDCPMSGVFGSCTRTAVALFQNEFKIPGDGTIVGAQTRAKLNELYGER